MEISHDVLRAIATGLVVALGCVFWLGVNVFDGWVQRNIYPKIRLWWARKKASLREKISRRHPGEPADHLGSSAGVGKKHIGH